ncbi:uncharacterized protein LOC105696445 isoform X2 [Orussus abietinus]|uniref:uncharacterized protein LOC105696445 isoform X2 n=1 Tax=Orussus abietinus TaxID=222816 RepID=UPI000626BC54|nr:uncharacterized protein LOC105696445 isoform X2 [Orussus abietinus]
MDSIDVDMFSSDDEKMVESVSDINPVEECLNKQLHEVQDHIRSTMSEIKDVQAMTEGVLQRLHSRTLHGESASSDSDVEWYTTVGKPVLKNSSERVKRQSLVVKRTWQNVIDDHWILGVVLRNATKRTLRNLGVYMTTRHSGTLFVVSTFWEKEDELWTRIGEIGPGKNGVLATAFLDLPKFDSYTMAEAFGVISYEDEEKLCQLVVPIFRLTSDAIVSGAYALNFTQEAKYSVVAMRTISFERVLEIDIKDQKRFSRFLALLTKASFEKVTSTLYVVKSDTALRNSIAEVISKTDDKARIRMSTRYLGKSSRR